MYAWLVAQAEGPPGGVGASALLKIVSWKPKSSPPSDARFPVTYHHSVRKVGCGP